MVDLSKLLELKSKWARHDERPSVDFLHAAGQTEQLGRGWPMNREEKGQIKVFIVDDNEDSANLLVEAMQFYGYQTVVAYGGVEALEAIHRAMPQVVILDLQMPEMPGFEMARRLRATRASDDLLLIALTGWTDHEAGEASKAAGFDYHFVKPADPGTLSALIEEEAFRRRVTGRG